MPRLSDIVKEGVSSRVRWRSYHFVWGGSKLDFDTNLINTATMLFSTEWENDEPTVADVLRERGYHTYLYSDGSFSINSRQYSLSGPPITSSAEAVRICDFLDSLGGGK